MKIEIAPTSEMLNVKLNGVDVPARVWVGSTDKGTPVEAYVVSVVPLCGESIEDEVPDFMRPAREVFQIEGFEKKP